MEIHSLGPCALLVSAGEAELHRWGVNPLYPGAEDLVHLSRWALKRRGLELERLREIRALCAQRSLLLLLELEAPAEEWFPFPELALALDAISALPEPPEGVLAWDRGTYFLQCRTPGQGAILSEFAAPLPPRKAEGLDGRATLILNENTLRKLWKAMKS